MLPLVISLKVIANIPIMITILISQLFVVFVACTLMGSDVVEDDGINTDSPNSDRSSVCTPMQGFISGFISCAEIGNSSTTCVLTYDFPDRNSQMT